VLESHARSEVNSASLYTQVGRRCVYVHVCIIRGVACLLYSVLLNPVTTWCGHTFCRDCICRSFDHSPNCPVCRTTLSEVRCSLPLHAASVMCDLHGFLMPPSVCAPHARGWLAGIEGTSPEETRLVLPSLTLLPPLKRAAVWGECYLCLSCVWEVSLICM